MSYNIRMLTVCTDFPRDHVSKQNLKVTLPKYCLNQHFFKCLNGTENDTEKTKVHNTSTVRKEDSTNFLAIKKG